MVWYEWLDETWAGCLRAMNGTIHATLHKNEIFSLYFTKYLKKVNQSRCRPEVPRGFQEVKFVRSSDNNPEWW